MAAYRLFMTNSRADCLQIGISSDSYAQIEYGRLGVATYLTLQVANLRRASRRRR